MNNRFCSEKLINRIRKIGPVSVYPVVNDLDSLAMNGMMILHGEAEIIEYV